MKWRKVIRIIHRDFGYIAFGLTIVYAVSGIAVNHASDWNPNYLIERNKVSIKVNQDSLMSTSQLVALVTSTLNENDSVISYFRSGQLKVDIFFEGKSIAADLENGFATIETVKSRSVLREANFLHLNAPKLLWTYVADVFAVMLIFLAFTGLFMIKGKKGITGRGKYLTMLGIVIPIIFLIAYF